jgi:hypothetical protein
VCDTCFLDDVGNADIEVSVAFERPAGSGDQLLAGALASGSAAGAVDLAAFGGGPRRRPPAPGPRRVVWSRDPPRAARVGEQLEVGSLWINAHKALAVHQPFGGVKRSGIGLENGIWGLDSFTDLQTQYEAR